MARTLASATAADAAERELQALGPAADFGWHTQQEYALRAATDIVVVLGGNRCLPLTEPVWMADGTKKPLGSVQIGDRVLAGGVADSPAVPSGVIAVHRAGSKPVFRVEFTDGTTLTVTDDHRLPVRWKAGKDVPVVWKSFGEIRERWSRAESAKQRPSLMVPGWLEFDPAGELPIPAYTMGALLGDGSLTQTDAVGFTSADAPVVDRLRAELATSGEVLHHYGRYAYSIRCETQRRRPDGAPLPGATLSAIRTLGLSGRGSHDKFIPPAYVRATPDQRALFLAGLIDTDGSHREFSSCSLALATGFMDTVRSLGGRATMARRFTRCTNAVGQPMTESFRVAYCVPRIPVSLDRKRQRGGNAHNTNRRYIRSITPAGVVECGDITVDHAAHTYLAGTAGIVVSNSGKSQVGVGIVSRLARREGPIYRRLRRPQGRPLNIWVAPQTDEKAKSLWEPRLLSWCEGLNATYVQAPHRVIRWSDAQGGGSIWIKSQEQGFMSFESDDVDLVLFDEEPEDRRVYASAKTRLATTNGIVALTFTPLNGMTWTFDELFEPVAKPGFQIADRVWRQGNEVTVIQMGMADNPEAVAGGGVARMMADPGISTAEKNARLYGVYGFTEGLLFPMWADLKAEMAFSPYLLDRLPRDRPYLWYLLADPNKRHGALLCAIDGAENQYVCAEHYAEGIADSQHAEGYRAMLAEFKVKETDIQAFADPGGAGAQAIINLAEVGFFAQPVPKDPGSVAASIKRLRRLATMDRSHQHPVTGATPAPHIYFLRSLRSQWQTAGHKYDESRLLWELRQYRQKPDTAPDTPIKRFDDVVDPLRYLQLAHAEGAEFEVFDRGALERKSLDPLSRKEAEQYDAMLRRLEAEALRRQMAVRRH